MAAFEWRAKSSFKFIIGQSLLRLLEVTRQNGQSGRQSTVAESFIERFVQAGLDDAKKRGLDGIICGHIHRAAMFERDGLIYANDGDWVESLTALTEDADGNLVLIDYRGKVLSMIESMKPRPEFRLVA